MDVSIIYFDVECFAILVNKNNYRYTSELFYILSFMYSQRILEGGYFLLIKLRTYLFFKNNFRNCTSGWRVIVEVVELWRSFVDRCYNCILQQNSLFDIFNPFYYFARFLFIYLFYRFKS